MSDNELALCRYQLLLSCRGSCGTFRLALMINIGMYSTAELLEDSELEGFLHL